MHGYPGGWEQLREDEEAEDAAAEEREREAEEADEREQQARMDEFDRGHDAYIAEQWEQHGEEEGRAKLGSPLSMRDCGGGLPGGTPSSAGAYPKGEGR